MLAPGAIRFAEETLSAMPVGHFAFLLNQLPAQLLPDLIRAWRRLLVRLSMIQPGPDELFTWFVHIVHGDTHFVIRVIRASMGGVFLPDGSIGADNSCPRVGIISPQAVLGAGSDMGDGRARDRFEFGPQCAHLIEQAFKGVGRLPP